MKKVFAAAISSVVIAAMCLFMAACSTTFVGVYKFKSMRMDMGGVTINYEAGKEYNGVTFSAELVTLEVNGNGTYTMIMSLMGNNEREEGTWEERDGKYYLITEGEEQEVSLKGKEITFSTFMNGVSATLVLKK